MSFERAIDFASIPFFISTAATPLFGFIADRYGRKLLLLTMASLMLITAHCILGFSYNLIESDHGLDTAALIGVILFGTAMSLGASLLWPMVLLVVDDTKYHATALGISSCIDNGIQATSFLIVGALTIEDGEEQGQYRNVSIWITALSLSMLIFTLLLWHSDDELDQRHVDKTSTAEEYERTSAMQEESVIVESVANEDCDGSEIEPNQPVSLKGDNET